MGNWRTPPAVFAVIVHGTEQRLRSLAAYEEGKVVMRKNDKVVRLALGLALCIGLLVASQALVSAEAPLPAAPQATPTAAPAGSSATPTAVPSPTRMLEGVVATRTPEPTATPDRIQQEVNQIAAQVGLSRTSFLGLPASDWIGLGISVFYVLAGYLIGTWLISRFLPRLVRRTATEIDDLFLAEMGSALRWLVVIVTLQFATSRLVFLDAELKTILRDVYYTVGALLVFRILWKSVDLGERWYRARSAEAGREDELAPLIVLLVRVGRVLVALVGLTVLLSHFGVNVAALTAAVGLSGLALSLAAKDTISDAIAGFIILVDRPFRIGDRIEIPGVGTWGDVIDIGLRTTRIRTRDNRMVIVPNSVIGSNQVINYTYPDPRYRIETRLGIAYGTDIEFARRTIVGAVRQVEGVLPDRPVEALYAEMGDSAMIFRVRWWIGSYTDTRRVEDRVHTALQHALDEAGIECPFPTQSVNLEVRPEASERLAAAIGRANGGRQVGASGQVRAVDEEGDSGQEEGA